MRNVSQSQSTLKFKPNDGISVRLYGDITFANRGGSIQIKVAVMEEDGVGDLFIAFEKMKTNLEKEGLSKKNKKTITFVSNKDWYRNFWFRCSF